MPKWPKWHPQPKRRIRAQIWLIQSREREKGEKRGKNWKCSLTKFRMDSGWLQVARGGYGAKAPPLVSHLVPCNRRGRRLVSWSRSVPAKGIPRVCQDIVAPTSLGYPLSAFNKTLLSITLLSKTNNTLPWILSSIKPQFTSSTMTLFLSICVCVCFSPSTCTLPSLMACAKTIISLSILHLTPHLSPTWLRPSLWTVHWQCRGWRLVGSTLGARQRRGFSPELQWVSTKSRGRLPDIFRWIQSSCGVVISSHKFGLRQLKPRSNRLWSPACGATLAIQKRLIDVAFIAP